MQCMGIAIIVNYVIYVLLIVLIDYNVYIDLNKIYIEK